MSLRGSSTGIQVVLVTPPGDSGHDMTRWLVGRRIVEQEQVGKRRAGYGDALLERLAADLTARTAATPKPAKTRKPT